MPMGLHHDIQIGRSTLLRGGWKLCSTVRPDRRHQMPYSFFFMLANIHKGQKSDFRHQSDIIVSVGPTIVHLMMFDQDKIMFATHEISLNDILIQMNKYQTSYACLFQVLIHLSTVLYCLPMWRVHEANFSMREKSESGNKRFNFWIQYNTNIRYQMLSSRTKLCLFSIMSAITTNLVPACS